MGSYFFETNGMLEGEVAMGTDSKQREMRWKIGKYRELIKYLFKVTSDKDIVVEIIKALQTQEEIEKLEKCLKDLPYLVLAEVYDKVSDITEGRFQKNFVRARELKKGYLKNMDDQILIQLIKCLQEEGVFCLYDWDLTDEEKYLFEEAKPGDTLHIETEMRPALFFDEEENILIFAYTSQMEIPQKHYKETVIKKTSLNFILTLIRSIRNTGKNTFLLLDYDSDDYLEIPGDHLERVMSEI